MDAFDLETNEYLTWMGVHNYALTTIENPQDATCDIYGNFARRCWPHTAGRRDL